MTSVKALNTGLPKRPSAHLSHSLLDMDALDLQRPGYPVSFDGQIDGTAAVLDLAMLGFHVSGAEPIATKPQTHHHGHQVNAQSP
ncbi:hypothetical protein FRC08_014418 [Ceratobasidium sp. 394]|nr:hypothetical protein FRC08_014418 [Ceratobasidium sp. 394]KAG9102113.1 hypothetical protein FS749_015696 [Ceratobasidium sp. UAMH 11750]